MKNRREVTAYIWFARLNKYVFVYIINYSHITNFNYSKKLSEHIKN